MDLLLHIDPERLSHAYVVEGEHEESRDAVRALMAHLDIRTDGNPDFYERVHDNFTIQDAHDLRYAQSLHASPNAKKIFVVAFRTIGHESQNALLKTIEEPTAHTHFFFLVRSGAILLPTVRSRVQFISHKSQVGSPREGREEDMASNFLSATIPERLKMIAHMTKAKTDEKSEAKEDARNFLSALERQLARRLEGGDFSVAKSLDDVLYAERELSSRAPSLKLLLEHLALTIPRP